jgi:predicted negative regulator of RcsB-dependent stress response
MATTPTISRDPTVDAQVFWLKYRTEIVVAIVLAIMAIAGYGGYRFYSARQESTASEMLATAKTAHDYEEVVSQYPKTAAAASAYLLLAEAQRNERKFAESNATLQAFIDKNPKHELVSTAALGIAVNLQSMGKMDEALAAYQQVAAKYPTSFNAPVALISQIALLKAKNQDDAARRVCETVLTQYRESIWAGEAMRQLRTLKPSAAPQIPPGTVGTPSNAPTNLPPSIARPPTLPGGPVPGGASPGTTSTSPPKPK